MNDRLPILPPNAPRRNGHISRRIAMILLKLLNWRVTGEIPNVAQCVIAGAPHTSNIDGLYTLPAFLAVDLDVRIFGKQSLFNVPVLASILRWCGVMPIDRANAGDIVSQSIEQFQQNQALYLGIAVEGTRKNAPRWKSGYWRIAHGAGVPILPVALDYGRRTMHFFPLFHPSGDYAADEAQLIALFRDIAPRHPHRLSAPLAHHNPPSQQ